jgi:hypothetical protein
MEIYVQYALVSWVTMHTYILPLPRASAFALDWTEVFDTPLPIFLRRWPDNAEIVASWA